MVSRGGGQAGAVWRALLLDRGIEEGMSTVNPFCESPDLSGSAEIAPSDAASNGFTVAVLYGVTAAPIRTIFGRADLPMYFAHSSVGA